MRTPEEKDEVPDPHKRGSAGSPLGSTSAKPRAGSRGGSAGSPLGSTSAKPRAGSRGCRPNPQAIRRIDLPNIGATTVSISLRTENLKVNPPYSAGHLTAVWRIKCRKASPSGVQNYGILYFLVFSFHFSVFLEWLGYRSKQELKTPTIGVSPCMRGPDTNIITAIM